jgi:hypothetical protein
MPLPDADDGPLVRRYPWYDKRILCQLLGQPYLSLPRGRWVLKPAVSLEGLGYRTTFSDFPADVVVQPYQDGEYLCVDAMGSCVWMYSAARDGLHFRWFEYRGDDARTLSLEQVRKLRRIQETTEEPVSLEFLGDYCIEAHARLSMQLVDLAAAAGAEDPLEVCGGERQGVDELGEGWGYFSTVHWASRRPSVAACDAACAAAHDHATDDLQILCTHPWGKLGEREVDGRYRVFGVNFAVRLPEHRAWVDSMRIDQLHRQFAAGYEEPTE